MQSIILKYNLDGYIVFNSDVHLNEYIRECDRRVFKLSGFSGSNGTIIIGRNSCLITDGRYYIQALNESKFPLYKGKICEFLTENNYKRVSFDTRTIASRNFEYLKDQFSKNGIKLVETEFSFTDLSDQSNAVDQNDHSGITDDSIIYLENHNLKDYLQIPGKLDKSENLLKEYLSSLGFKKYDCNVTGSFYLEKIEKVRKLIENRILIVTELDTIAWILNLRGSDVEYNPIFFSFLIITKNETVLFCNKTVILKDITVKKYEEFDKYLERIAGFPAIISGDCNQSIFSKFTDIIRTNKIRELQAEKNEIELCGMALAYFFDGIALTELFAFIQNKDGLTEENISNKLHEIKQSFKGYVQPSFGTISATGENAAIIHHQASPRAVNKDQVYLIDCGSQYYFGTTDTTRTLFFGNEVGENLRHDYTLVLRGQMGAMMKEYEPDATYSEIDRLSRFFLKEEDKNFEHATGHGVGHFLCVHESPPAIYEKNFNLIKPNQVFSVEPGYYKEGEYGIRIENLVISREDGDQMKLINITTVPYQNKLVDVGMLTAEEKEYYNLCNATCLKAFGGFLSEKALEFIKENSCAI